MGCYAHALIGSPILGGRASSAKSGSSSDGGRSKQRPYGSDGIMTRTAAAQTIFRRGRGKQRPYNTWKSQESIAWRQESAFARIEVARIGAVFACPMEAGCVVCTATSP
jgi:hypothetical protein